MTLISFDQFVVSLTMAEANAPTSHQRELDNLKEKDPEFYEFLQVNI